MIIPDDDYLQEIFGHADEVINEIGFKTYKGMTRVFGVTVKGFPFRYAFPLYTFTTA